MQLLTTSRYAELFVSIIVGCMPTLPKFGSAMRSAWSTTRSKLLGSSQRSSTKSGTPSRDRKSWNDVNDDSRDHYKAGAIRLEDHPFEYLDRVDQAHLAAV